MIVLSPFAIIGLKGRQLYAVHKPLPFRESIQFCETDKWCLR
jgi:hypothetical protein